MELFISSVIPAITLFIGLILGYFLAFFTQKSRQTNQPTNNHQLKSFYDQKIDQLNDTLNSERQIKETLLQKSSSYETQLSTLQSLLTKLDDKFVDISSNVLNKNTEHFLRLVEERHNKYRIHNDQIHSQQTEAVSSLLDPMKKELNRLHEVTSQIEYKREQAYTALKQKCDGMSSQFAQVFDNPIKTGAWGEVQFEKIIELSGMVKHVDYQCQTAYQGDHHDTLRPDAIIRLPQDKCIVVDTKTSMSSYVDFVNNDKNNQEQKNQAQKEHIKKIKNHIKNISNKSYIKHIHNLKKQPVTPEFIVMFVPLEGLYSIALEHNIDLFEEAAKYNVIITTPSSLFALVKTVAFIWKEHDIIHNAKNMARIASCVLDELNTLSTKLEKLGKSLDSSIKAYNDSLNVMNNKLIQHSEKLENLGAQGKILGNIQPLRTLAHISENHNHQRQEPNPPRDFVQTKNLNKSS